jgi:metal-responsive CopG/Arc/MetJ family transcriptional regulator
MKAVQIMMDERLLERLDATDEVRREGRSAILRRAVEAYLRHREQVSIASRYRAAYGAGGGLGKEWDDWEAQGVWPDE